MIPKIIDTEKLYKDTLSEVERLIAKDPKQGTPEADRLALLATLLEVYESKHYHFELPEPIAAIRFRMEEQGLLQRDLVPYMGSKSKVSEVLSGKRPLTIQMIRALNVGLGIPAEVLLQEPRKTACVKPLSIDWKELPLSEMNQRGWFGKKVKNVLDHTDELKNVFLAPLGGALPTPALCRRTAKGIDVPALIAWTARILTRAQTECCRAIYTPGTVTKEFIKEVVRLSCFDKGPLLAQEFLEKNGIALIMEPHLNHTKLDGGSILGLNGPVIGLTLRHDRLDSFWFTLTHELAHVAKHLKTQHEVFIDDLDIEPYDDPKEKEADALCNDVLIPSKVWRTSRAYLQKTPPAVLELAKQLSIHPSIIAGRIRHDAKNYTILNEFIGHKQVKCLFPNLS